MSTSTNFFVMQNVSYTMYPVDPPISGNSGFNLLTQTITCLFEMKGADKKSASMLQFE